jgi:hypothetical protein
MEIEVELIAAVIVTFRGGKVARWRTGLAAPRPSKPWGCGSSRSGSRSASSISSFDTNGGIAIPPLVVELAAS